MGYWNRNIQCGHEITGLSPIPALTDLEQTMNAEKRRYFGIAFVVFALVASLMIYLQGGFDSMQPSGLAILLVAFAAVGLLIYRFVRGNSEDPL